MIFKKKCEFSKCFSNICLPTQIDIINCNDISPNFSKYSNFQYQTETQNKLLKISSQNTYTSSNNNYSLNKNNQTVIKSEIHNYY